MKEITRIHIAKTSYEIEITAKKVLETYLKALEAYSDDAEITQDVEIRITELLAERGVKKGQVITEADVVALRKQLGEPQDFSEEGDIAIGGEVTSEPTRRLYRNTDNALLGGVLSGIAAFFNINPVWTRLLFIILLLGSFGTALIVYIVLWVVVPPAKTAADKLQMTGRAVTVGAIRELNEAAKTKAKNASPAIQRALLILAGIVSAIIALTAVLLTVFMVGAALWQGREYLSGSQSEWLTAAFGLFVASGLLCTALFSLAAYASFAKRFNKRIAMSAGLIMIAGIITTSVAAGFVQYAGVEQQREITANTHTRAVALPVEAMWSLHIGAQDMQVRYTVTNETPSATLRTIGDKAKKSNVELVNDQGKLTVRSSKLSFAKNEDCVHIWSCDGQRRYLEIKGPALATITTETDANVLYNAQTQPNLTVDAKNATRFYLEAGNIKSFAINAKEDTRINTENATVARAEVTIEAGADVRLGAVESLVLTDQNSCPSNKQAYLTAWKVSGDMLVNGMSKPPVSTNLACTQVQVEGGDEA